MKLPEHIRLVAQGRHADTYLLNPQSSPAALRAPSACAGRSGFRHLDGV